MVFEPYIRGNLAKKKRKGESFPGILHNLIKMSSLVFRKRKKTDDMSKIKSLGSVAGKVLTKQTLMSRQFYRTK